MKKAKIIVRSMIAVIVLVLFVAFIMILKSQEVSAYTPNEYNGSLYETNNSLSLYKDKIKGDEKRPNKTYEVDVLNDFTYIDEEYNTIPTKKTFDGIDVIYIPETNTTTFIVDGVLEGYYNIYVKYYNVEGRNSNICRGIMINNEYQFTESENLIFTRTWVDNFDVKDKRKDKNHDQKPGQTEKHCFKEITLKDAEGYYESEYLFKFEEGTNTITFTPVQEPIAIASIKLYQKADTKCYADVYEEYIKNYQKKSNSKIAFKQQAESSYEKSSPALSPVANYSSFKVEPYARFLTRYNTIGGDNWDITGDWISWCVEVEEEGLYQLTFKTLQNFKSGQKSSRILYINDEIPFEECKNISFKYSSDWQNTTIGNESGAYWFHLKKGKNIIKLENTIGDYKGTVRNINVVISTLNKIYRKVIMRTGVTPSKYQDYNLKDTIPGLYDSINESIKILDDSIKKIVELSGSRSDLISSLERTKYQLETFNESERKIQTGLSELETNITALGSWVQTVTNQPVLIDYILVHGESTKLPKAKANIFQKIWNDLILLIGSYKADTSLKSSVSVDGPTITVWIMTGRDQSNLLRQIIDEDFTIQHGINVDLKLVTSSVLLPATLAGNGPDVAIGVGQNIPVNWGIRKSVVDLSKFSDFETYAKNFYSSAITPFSFNGATYALPDTQDFLIQFVRTDIFEETEGLHDDSGNLYIPNNWEEVIDILPILQRKYLDYYIPNTTGAISGVMYAMLEQYGGRLYLDEGAKCAMMEDASANAFYDFVNYYNNYGFVVEANFTNRFRTGEMPIGIANFTLYNTLAVSAPEIRGNWKFATLPGTKKDDTTTSYATTSSSTGTIILESSKNKNASWEFMKWWLGASAQESYARGIEAILGAAARYPTANIEAFKNLPWKISEYNILEEQRKVAVGIPTVPGDYIVGRYIDNAFRKVINEGINPSDSLFTYNQKINAELKRKRKEFNLD